MIGPTSGLPAGSLAATTPAPGGGHPHWRAQRVGDLRNLAERPAGIAITPSLAQTAAFPHRQVYFFGGVR
ncbi:MAG: hypothetical protein AW07_01565 [Candidatus Accumulibacter sp. SK-11]|nr:MAG: hypothetical protein AW07_01565 [Candidatus Accumulibacter sp. SK-11]